MKKAFLYILLAALLIGSIGAIVFLLSQKNEIEIENKITEKSSQPDQIIVDEKGEKTFNPDNVRWEEIKPEGEIWTGRDAQFVAVFKNKIFLSGGVVGGKVTPPPVYEQIEHENDLWVTTDLKKWDLIDDDVPWKKRRSAASVEFGGKLYMIGGWVENDNKTKSDVWMTEDGISWKLVSSKNLWHAREGHTAVVFKDKIWIAGGVDFFDKHINLNDVWYSEDGKNWTEATKNAPWSPRYDHTMVVYKDKLYLIGGFTTGDIVYNDIWASDDGINWEKVTGDAPFLPRHGHVSFDYNGYLWVAGGWCEDNNRGGLNDTWYSSDGINWTETAKGAGWPGREDVAGIIWDGKMVIMGGMADMGKEWEWRNDIWITRIRTF